MGYKKSGYAEKTGAFQSRDVSMAGEKNRV